MRSNEAQTYGAIANVSLMAEFDPTPSLLIPLVSKPEGVVLMVTLRPKNSTVSKLGVGCNSPKRLMFLRRIVEVHKSWAH